MWNELIKLIEEISKEHEVEFRYWIGIDKAGSYEYISMIFYYKDYKFIHYVSEYELKVFEPTLLVMQIHKRMHECFE